MEIVIRKTPEQVSLQAADILEPYVSEGATLGLATGSTPLGTYQELIRRYNESGLSFANNQAFLLDEYVGLPRDHEQSYYRTTRREFTEHIDIKDEAVSSPDGLADNIDEAGRAFATRAASIFKFSGSGPTGTSDSTNPAVRLTRRPG